VRVNNFLARIGRALTTPLFSGSGGASGLGGWNMRGLSALLGMPVIDPENEVGELWRSSIPFSCLKWEQRASIELGCVVQRNDANGEWVNDARHSALVVLRNPNPFHSTAQFWDCVRWDWHLDGNAYIWKERSASGKMIRLWWIPSWMIEPRWEEGGTEFISCYEYSVNGQVFALPVSDVIHLRNGLDPRWQGRKGLSDFAAVHREVLSDDEAAVLVASLMKNGGMPGVIISPKSAGAGSGMPAQMNKEQRAEFGEYWNENFSGSNRGKPFIQSIPVDVQFPAYNPQQLVLDKVRAIPEQRIAGAFGLPLSVLQLGSGLVNSNSKANKSDDREQAYESCIIPNSMMIAEQFSRQFLPEFGSDTTFTRVWFDASNVRCLQADEDALAKRLVVACGGPYMTPNEARKRAKLAVIEGGDELRTAKTNTDKTTNSEELATDTSNEDEPAPTEQESEEAQ
jgi:HK97 family phage portal protein